MKGKLQVEKNNNQFLLTTLVDTQKLADFVIKRLTKFKNNQAIIIFLNGDLGSGKTTFSRMLIKQLGIYENIKSPSFNLIEQYKSPNKTINHLDLYRINNQQEIQQLELGYYFQQNSINIIEWGKDFKSFLEELALIFGEINFDFTELNKRKAEVNFFV